ncbi:Sodium/hydrogen exchanger family-domain-containing protein [Boeremia exigua]|uniref:Sodium/hydrogen exchanger family-domain-containing protein n=1 Tax=Boeremia exigua TaxID=749465 RepID=UPI001E8DAC96|nr:Sodium/hydrogen exchanger family-domain-containing protein [Boeremia exigua]KAH6622182.1 Sodium/hydrogen exchanger family-domain-containing protein [Boeremia exigua]
MAADASEVAASLPYHEPGIETLLILVSFLLLLNVVNAALDRLLYCGLLGQVLIGIAWGTPGAKWLPTEVEEVIVQLGYLGLILLVYEGGLHTSFQSLKANLLLSSGVAITGICVPIGLSYTLQGLLDATPLQAFAAGAALCSTSLGTTFTVLGSSGLSSSRLGVVLTSAAMMDDVVGLVMVQVISNLGAANFNAVTVLRPVLVSIAFAVVVPIACLFIVKPCTLWLNRHRESHPAAPLNQLLCKKHIAFTIHTVLLVALITGATYAGTSNLFAAYIAGASISWWDSEVPHTDTSPGAQETTEAVAIPSNEPSGATEGSSKNKDADASGVLDGSVHPTRITNTVNGMDNSSGVAIYEHYYLQVVSKMLQPLFFASIGFSIPITRMFRGAIVWRGIVYTILMAFAKVVCGLWLVRLTIAPTNTVRRVVHGLKLPAVPHLWGRSKVQATHTTAERATTEAEAVPSATASIHERRSSPNPPKPLSIHPPLILALAMCARGEIGFLISGVAESTGVFSPSGVTSSEPSDIFLVVTWAIVLCTSVGPLGVGLSVRRVRKLQARKEREREGAGRDVLGVWGVE